MQMRKVSMIQFWGLNHYARFPTEESDFLKYRAIQHSLLLAAANIFDEQTQPLSEAYQ